MAPAHTNKLLTDVSFTLNNGKKMPALGLGTANMGPHMAKTTEAVIAAIEAGYRHIDTARMYGSEEYVGAAIKDVIARGIVKREDLFITTKIWCTYFDNPAKCLDISLKALGLDYVDLLLQHWPLCMEGDEDGNSIKREDGTFVFNPNGSYIKFYQKMEDLYRTTDKARSLGVSNYSNAFLTELLKVARVKPVVNQIECHPRLPLKDIVEFDKSLDILITAYSPLGAAGAPNLKLPLVQELAQKYNVTGNEVLASYHVQSGRSVIPRSVNISRVKENIHLAPLTAEDLAGLDQIGIDEPHSVMMPEIWAKMIGFTTYTKSE
ncbi:hypothetical protein BABINDRAFT_36288 [Babjeviella inositovora NRRL Y-12698]|uniref:NADP-dependent oxidoreductase domain-containing protein n=1 Tax=Babjeviella inositovora NRRL Y-12698 TaxID=984486 RepID=A0A1E3QQS2_9ASCO|nr:uncharacterized protein BABINDRAFT_36288 [Babjeviella inositovora NRRL Y-12698]ODQ80035.1 hypothetical protein BABINDRAFT_36288 [Babjeviella inositovora NRRL Y-12698]